MNNLMTFLPDNFVGISRFVAYDVLYRGGIGA
jgi:hypothetical protein